MKTFGKAASWTFLIVFSLGFSLTVGEVLIRKFKPQRTYKDLLQLAGDYYADSPFNNYTLKKNYSGLLPSGHEFGEFVQVSTNSFGLRSPEISLKKEKGVKRILILGDSYTFGLFVGDDQTYPSVLEDLLGSKQIQVLNAGYADGRETDEQYCWLLNQGLAFEPDIIIYGMFLGNDISGIRPNTWIQTDTLGLPTKIKDTTRYIDNDGVLRSKVGGNNIAGSEPIYQIPVLKNSHLALYLYHGFHNRVVYKKNRRPREGFAMEKFPNILQKSNKEFDKKEQVFLKIVEAMSNVSHENKAEFLIVMHPTNFQVDPGRFISKVFPNSEISIPEKAIKRDYYHELEMKLDDLKIPYLNILEEMKANPGDYYPDNGEIHYGVAGHRFVAERIKNTLLDINYIGIEEKSL